LADDLRAAIDQRPIKAKPPNVLARTVKWSRRHHVAVLAGLIVLAMVTVGLSVGSVLIVRERNAAVTERNKHMMYRLTADNSLLTPQMAELRESLLKDAFEFYEQLLKRHSKNSAVSPYLREYPGYLYDRGFKEESAEFQQRLVGLLNDPRDRGHYNAAYLCKFSEAARYYESAVITNPDDDEAALGAALSHLMSGDRASYEAMCRHMLTRFGSAQEQFAVWRTCWACLLTSSPVGELERLVEMAEFAAPGSPEQYVAGRRIRGLAAYRAGDWPGALIWCAKGFDKSDQVFNHAERLLIEAMARHRLGDGNGAKAAYNEAVKDIHNGFPSADVGPLGPNWFDWVFCELLRREAEALIKPTTNSEQSTLNP
jgi:tetratricopeptide (TPR) repeat protein